MTSWTAITRRSFLAGAAATGATVAFAGCEKKTTPQQMGTPSPPVQTDVDDNPIVMHPDDKAAAKFFGDDPERFHPLLWNKQASVLKYGGLPVEVSERVKVCIVGGGLSGLSAAYLLREFQPLVLEGAVRLGGNAKAHRWSGVTYGLGSAYITNATHGEDHMKMLADLQLTGRFDDPTHDQMYVAGVVHPDFWFGGSDKARAADFRVAWDYFEKVRKTAYPEMPFDPTGDLTRDQWTALDKRSFADEVRAQLGTHLHPHVEEVIRQYCWSSFGADHSEISAAAGLNFLASDLGGMFVFPGGNATISQALVDRLRRDFGKGHVRSSLRVLDIRRADDGVRVTYLGTDDKLRTVLADTCVVSTPKFVAKRLIDDLPREQLDAIAKIKYRAYVVGHVLVDQARAADFHDLYCIAGETISPSAKDEVAKRPFTDCVLATFASNGHPSKTVLNLFRGLPYDESRMELYQDGSYAHHKALMEPAIPVIVKALGMDPAKVHDFRMSGWGHPMVIPTPGLISDGVPAKAAAPHHDRIFFAQQDNNAMSAFESGFSAASDAAGRVRKVLQA